MTKRAPTLICALLLMASTGALGAQTITVSGNPALLRISTAVAGSEPTAPAPDASRTFTVTTPNPGGNTKFQILMSLNANMPANVTLTATLGIPPGSNGVSTGAIALDVTPRALLTTIKKNITGTASTTYQLTATVAAGVIPLTSRIVTYTVTTFP
jgi:hypothetical protein